MSKKYVFFTLRISGVAGSQRYLSRKARWLTAQGYSVAIVCEQGGEVLIPLPSSSTIIIEPLLACRPSMAGKTRRSLVLEHFKMAVADSSYVAIESLTLDHALWAELCAANINAKHMVFCLDEKLYSHYSLDERSFFRRKRDSGEIFFIDSGISTALFGSEIDPQRYVLNAYQDNPVEDVPFSVEKLASVDFRIGTITRVEKHYVNDLINTVCSICKRHPDKSFSLTIVGDAESPLAKKRVLDLSSAVPNLTIEILGYMSTIPLKLIQSFDVAICKARSSYLCASNGVPTFHYSLYEDMCIGLFGIDFHNDEEAKNATPIDLFTALEKLLFQNSYDKSHYRYEIPTADYWEHMRKMAGCSPVPKEMGNIVLAAKPSTKNMCISLFVRLFEFHPKLIKAAVKSKF